MDMVLIFWMVLLILCIVIEILTLGLTTIWFAAGALVAIFAALLYAPIFVQVILFLLVSLTLLFFTRPIAVKYFNRDRVKTNVESMVGRQAIVTGEIDNVQATGQVTVSGQEWSARSWDDKVMIPAGAVVVVVAISGVKLIVRTEQRKDVGAPVKEEVQQPMDASPLEGLEAQQPMDASPLEGPEAQQPMTASPGEEPEAPKEEPRLPGEEPQAPEAEPEEKEPEEAKADE